MATTTTSTEERALALLGQGLGAEVVASAVGVSPSRISQLISDPEFAAKVAELRFSNLVKHNARDEKYDKLEDKLLEKMENLIPFMMKPFEVLKAISVINGAKRRGISTPEQTTGQQTVIPLILPAAILQNFSAKNIQVNIHNQVIKAGEQELVTVQSSRMDALVAARTQSQGVLSHEPPTHPARAENARPNA
jgi:hypothetical protein